MNFSILHRKRVEVDGQTAEHDLDALKGITVQHRNLRPLDI